MHNEPGNGYWDMEFMMRLQSREKTTPALVQWALCTAALLPELKPAPCFLSVIIGQID